MPSPYPTGVRTAARISASGLARGTAIEHSRVSLRKCVIAGYLCPTSVKGISSLKPYRDPGATQRTAWLILHRLRKPWAKVKSGDRYDGPVEMDEVYIGGNQKKRYANNRLPAGRRAIDKLRVVGDKNRHEKRVMAKAVANPSQDKAADLHAAVTGSGAKVCTGDPSFYDPLPNRFSVHHESGWFVSGNVQINGGEYIWALFKRGFHRTYQRISAKHLQRYLDEFVGRNNIRDKDTINQMKNTVTGLVRKRLLYRDLVI